MTDYQSSDEKITGRIMANRQMISQCENEIRQLESARLRGRIGGAKMIWTKKQVAAAYKTHKTYEATAKALGCSRITVIRKIGKPREVKKEEKDFKKTLERSMP